MTRIQNVNLVLKDDTGEREGGKYVKGLFN